MRARLTSPTVGLRPTTPLIAAGQVTDPSVSVPIAASTSPAATAAALPDEEPHGSRSNAYGFRVCPPTALQPEIDASDRMFAHSDRLVLLRITAPAARSRCTSGASRCVTLSSSAILPAVGQWPVSFNIVLKQDRVAIKRPAHLLSPINGPGLVEVPPSDPSRAITALNLRIDRLYPPGCSRGRSLRCLSAALTYAPGTDVSPVTNTPAVRDGQGSGRQTRAFLSSAHCTK